MWDELWTGSDGLIQFQERAEDIALCKGEIHNGNLSVLP